MLIKYGMSRNNLQKWGLKEALREIYQNFNDFGEFSESVVDLNESLIEVTLRNDWNPVDLQFLKIGESGKRDDKTTVGEHGEGLKMAFMILAREDHQAYLTLGENDYSAVFYEDEFLGECFGLKISKKENNHSGFEIKFTINTVDFDRYKNDIIKEEDVIFDCWSGQIVDKPKGSIYLRGEFVARIERLNRSYNFKSGDIELGRDRDMPSDYDIDSKASSILSYWDGLKVEDLNSQEASYIYTIPDKLSEKFIPEMVGSKVVFRSGETQASEEVSNKLMRNEKQQKRVAKIKFTVSRKKTPLSILKEFKDNNFGSLTPKAKTDLLVIMKKAKNW